MEDKEREAYFQMINQLMQYNMQLTMNTMTMFTTFMQNLTPRITAPSPMGMAPISPNFSAFMPSREDINKIMKSMGLGGTTDDKDLT